MIRIGKCLRKMFMMIAIGGISSAFLVGAQAQPIVQLPDAGGYLARRGVDTNSVEALRFALIDPSTHLESWVLRYLILRPMSALANDIAPYLHHPGKPWVRMMSAEALLKLNDTRGAQYLDSTVHYRLVSDNDKLEAIIISAQYGLFLYADTLIRLFNTSIRLGLSFKESSYKFFTAMELYAGHPGHSNLITDAIIQSYGQANNPVKKEIMHLLGDISSPPCTSFLLSVLQNEESGELASEALRWLKLRPTLAFIAHAIDKAGTENDITMRRQYQDFLRSLHTVPSVWRQKQLGQTEPDANMRQLMALVSVFFPPRPAAANSPLTVLDTLISQRQQVYTLAWLGDEEFSGELAGHLSNARAFLLSGDSLGCADEVRFFQVKVDEEYRDSLDGDTRFVTREGWKFLYYNARYVLERLPREGDPLELESFNAWVMIDGSVLVEWTTMSETDSYGFEVQKAQTSPEGFQSIPGSFVPGAGTTTEPQYYWYIDRTTSSGTWYYRVKQIDVDGTQHFSVPLVLEIAEGPIGLESFAAVPLSEKRVRIEWSTTREHRSKEFRLESSRGDSLHYGEVPGSRRPGLGTSNRRREYTHVDTRPVPGVWYYRLRYVDQDNRNRFTYSLRVEVR